MTVVTELEQLRTEAPPDVLPRVLVRTGLADGYTTRRSGLGEVWIAFNGRGVSACAPIDAVDDVEAYLRAVTGRDSYPEELPASLARQVDAALETGRWSKVPYDLRGVSSFGRSVLSKTAEIPPGEVRPYAWVAREIGRPAAVRAVGTALARNPVPVLIPCHRVVRSDGTIGQYAYGPERKQVILRSEGLDLEELASLTRDGVRLMGSTTTRIFCHPTCSRARRIRPHNRRRFSDEASAEAAGYRPCLICRPG